MSGRVRTGISHWSSRIERRETPSSQGRQASSRSPASSPRAAHPPFREDHSAAPTREAGAHTASSRHGLSIT